MFLISNLLHRNKFQKRIDLLYGIVLPIMIWIALFVKADLFSKIYALTVFLPLLTLWAVGFGSLVLRKRRKNSLMKVLEPFGERQ